ncbi:transposase domain-containing protein [Kitasatospora sp. DSM 101779]|nr:transposase domain-containing protein [Kitasatospora sp. DSM 101779]
MAESDPGGGLPPYLTACPAMASCLFPEDGPESVAGKVSGALPESEVRDAAWARPTPSGIAEARRRLGRDVLRETFYRVAEPVAAPGTRGAPLCGRRLTALHGFEARRPRLGRERGGPMPGPPAPSAGTRGGQP